jgi:polyisoprenoid-binding protein YceI
MGVVYLARHPATGLAALKFVHPEAATDPTFRARFRREVDAAGRVTGPRVARILDAGPDDDIPWLATTFVDGPTLRESANAGNVMAGERLVAFATGLVDALGTIHAAGIVHRDLKPSNILLTPEGPVVIDFGIAAVHESLTLTATGMQLGSPGWMAPEQVQAKRVTAAADVFTWALLVAFAASGDSPFGEGANAAALYYRIVHEDPQIPGLPAPLDDLVPAAVAKDPLRRPMVSDLAKALGLTPARPLPPAPAPAPAPAEPAPPTTPLAFGTGAAGLVTDPPTPTPTPGPLPPPDAGSGAALPPADVPRPATGGPTPPPGPTGPTGAAGPPPVGPLPPRGPWTAAEPPPAPPPAPPASPEARPASRPARPLLLVVAGIVLLVGLVAAALWAFVLADSAPEKASIDDASETLGDSDSGASTGGAASLAGEWVVDTSVGSFDDFSGTWAGYRFDEELASIGASTAVGRTPDVTGTMTVTEDGVTAAEVEVDMTSLESDESFRDDALRTRGLESNEYPTATFVLTEPVAFPEGLAEGETVDATATGELTLHGVTDEVTIELQAEIDGDRAVVVGQAPVALEDFDIDPPTGARVLSVDEEGEFEFQVFFTRR